MGLYSYIFVRFFLGVINGKAYIWRGFLFKQKKCFETSSDSADENAFWIYWFLSFKTSYIHWRRGGGGAYIPRGLCLDLVFRFTGKKAFNWKGS